MKKTSWLISVGMVLMLAACGSNKDNAAEQEASESEEILPIAVELTVPEKADVKESIVLETVVTQGDDLVDDANEVVYEIWEEGKKEDSHKIDSSNEGKGLYKAETSFDHDGKFHIQVHVTARDMHTMPEKVVTVGDGGEHTEGAGHEQGHEHGHAEGFSMHFMEPDSPAAGKNVELVTHLQMNNEAFEKAEVRYEIWREADEKHEWVDAKEGANGEYQASFTFKEAGTFTIVIHVMDENGLHEHEEHTVEVK
ncbi:FixH family protein [Sporosarcina sp. Te-1]|uniref:FixH family protein n=1 Tax=Sporosarcina sp. Te-1 TaxID=2818390 RepID=UPI001A9F2844|nr:FixH family protein [Sporosarcina sp. Te-1]QTD41319.1 FixH family protein [Sporosarcina sp. Te-1]